MLYLHVGVQILLQNKEFGGFLGFFYINSYSCLSLVGFPLDLLQCWRCLQHQLAVEWGREQPMGCLGVGGIEVNLPGCLGFCASDVWINQSFPL